MKLAYSDIQFELTRRCNQECMHCCRGKSENLDLSKEVIDAFFENNEITTMSMLKFSGGEPVLNASGFNYLIEKIIKKNIEVTGFMLSSNGLVYDQLFVDTLKKLNDYCRNFYIHPLESCGSFFISQSQYHKKYNKEVIDAYSSLPFFVPPSGINIIPPEVLLPYGNAAKNNLTQNIPNLDDVLDYDKTFKIVEYMNEDYLVFSCQYISSNGNVLKDGCISYEMMDKYAIGNVCNESIESMFNDKNRILSLYKK